MSTPAMIITVYFFGACREAAGTPEWHCELAAPADVARAWSAVALRFPQLERFSRSALFAVNEEHARPDQSLQDGDTLAIFPPVSGGAVEDVCEITREPIDKAGLERRLLAGEAGAVVTFDGVVREQTGGRRVVRLQYEAYEPMAVKELRRLAAEVRERWPEVARLGMVHRFGELEISESSVVIVVTSPHRRVAFEACRYAIDRLKQTVPIWKKEIFEDGEEWVEGGR
jgi:MoaE-MoaD fusion protein